MATLLDLYRAVRNGLKEWHDIGTQFQLTSEQAVDAVNRLRAAKVLQTVRGIGPSGAGGQFVDVGEGAENEQAALDLAKAAGVDMSAPLT